METKLKFSILMGIIINIYSVFKVTQKKSEVIPVPYQNNKEILHKIHQGRISILDIRNP